MDNCFQSETNDSYIHGYYKNLSFGVLKPLISRYRLLTLSTVNTWDQFHKQKHD